MKIVGRRGNTNLREYTLNCADCGSVMFLDTKKRRLVYRCTKSGCNGNHGADRRGRPLGVPASKEERYWRSKAHESFDKLWSSGYMEKDVAYKWLAFRTGLCESECHISKLNLDQCKLVIRESNKALKELGYEWNGSKGASRNHPVE